jgi:hypothetical protein
MTNAYRHDVACYLASLAHDRGTITYGELADRFGGTARGWGDALGGIAIRCRDHNLPLLPVLVVTKDTGLPSTDAALYEDLGLHTQDDVKTEQARCHSFNWLATPLWKRT